MKENYVIQEILLERTYAQLWQDMYAPIFNTVCIYNSINMNTQL